MDNYWERALHAQSLLESDDSETPFDYEHNVSWDQEPNVIEEEIDTIIFMKEWIKAHA